MNEMNPAWRFRLKTPFSFSIPDWAMAPQILSSLALSLLYYSSPIDWTTDSLRAAGS